MLPLLLLLSACNNKQDKTAAGKNENTDYLVSLDGIGTIKTKMKQDELETLLNQKVPLGNLTDTISGSWVDSATVKYKDAGLRLSFVRTYAYEKEDSFHMRITGIKTESPLCKTAGGIGIGSSKEQIIESFDNYLLIIGPGFDNDTDTIRSKSLYVITVREHREGPQMVFYLKNNKVQSIEVSSFYDDEE